MIDKATIADPKTRYGHGTGTRHFIVQRLTGALNVLFTLFFVWLVLSVADDGPAALVAALRHPLIALAMIGLLINTGIHMHVGMGEVIEDYVEDPTRNGQARAANTGFVALAIGIALVSVIKIFLWG